MSNTHGQWLDRIRGRENTSMTKQEAIEQFRFAKECIDQYGYDWLDERDIPMLDIAISALQEQIQREDDMK